MINIGEKEYFCTSLLSYVLQSRRREVHEVMHLVSHVLIARFTSD